MNNPKKSSLKDKSQLQEIKEEKAKTAMQEPSSESESSNGEDEFKQDEYFEQDGGAFQALLGLPEITLESLYANYKEKDKDVIQYMNEHSNFIQVHEGYPEFLMSLQGGNEGPKRGRSFQINSWSQDCGTLDFYSSLEFVNRYHAHTRQVQQELYDVLKPHNAQIMTHIDQAMLDECIAEFRRVLDIFENRVVEYKGREYVEDESVLGNSEKIVFFTKEMLAQLTLSAKSALDPYLMGKLDVQTIKFFDFPKVLKADCKYLMQRQQGTNASKWLIESTRRSMIEIAKRKKSKMTAAQNKITADLAAGFVGALN